MKKTYPNYPKSECPLLKREIDDSDCYCLALMCEDFIPKIELPEGIDKITDEMKDICMKCKRHPQ